MFSVSFCPLWGLFLLCSAESTLCSCIFRQTAACQILLSVLFPNTSCKNTVNLALQPGKEQPAPIFSPLPCASRGERQRTGPALTAWDA